MKVYKVMRTEEGVKLWVLSRTPSGQSSDSSTEISPKRSQQLVNHSPNGFEFGYHGSGPSQLALAVLLDAYTGVAPDPNTLAFEHYQDFKVAFIAGEKGEEFEITLRQIIEWHDARISGRVS
jgi:hypothetical protein